MTSTERRDHTQADKDTIGILKQTSHLRTSSTCSLVEASHQVSIVQANKASRRMSLYTGEALLRSNILLFMFERSSSTEFAI